ncbi:unnamed protein product [Darwinula stevensoni]|uniref:Uncharacterized protein n=1 Tax=Darwinula stevensoni TaxID=69355 RepID=A0A7R8WXS8_9CRUS|nr:unnamed protein product [Darwinula stevensoni]CAG0878613.1 unnamed protein product [Darwinula stevensoni]
MPQGRNKCVKLKDGYGGKEGLVVILPMLCPSRKIKGPRVREILTPPWSQADEPMPPGPGLVHPQSPCRFTSSLALGRRSLFLQSFMALREMCISGETLPVQDPFHAIRRHLAAAYPHDRSLKSSGGQVLESCRMSSRRLLTILGGNEFRNAVLDGTKILLDNIHESITSPRRKKTSKKCLRETLIQDSIQLVSQLMAKGDWSQELNCLVLEEVVTFVMRLLDFILQISGINKVEEVQNAAEVVYMFAQHPISGPVIIDRLIHQLTMMLMKPQRCLIVENLGHWFKILFLSVPKLLAHDTNIGDSVLAQLSSLWQKVLMGTTRSQFAQIEWGIYSVCLLLEELDLQEKINLKQPTKE